MSDRVASDRLCRRFVDLFERGEAHQVRVDRFDLDVEVQPKIFSRLSRDKNPYFVEREPRRPGVDPEIQALLLERGRGRGHVARFCRERAQVVRPHRHADVGIGLAPGAFGEPVVVEVGVRDEREERLVDEHAPEDLAS